MKKLTLYLDTSIIGGCFDIEFEIPTKHSFKYIKMDVYEAAISDITLYEINKAPYELIEKFLHILGEIEYNIITETEESKQLAQAYISANVLPGKCWDDARHVAIASSYNMKYIISWNFKHLVNVNRIRGFNAVNIQQGYSTIDIRTPLEVI
jgi:hypothetical protein